MDAWVRDILRCPACRGTLADGDASLACENPGCGLVYRVEDGIPVLLVDEAVAPDAAGAPAAADATAGPAGDAPAAGPDEQPAIGDGPGARRVGR